MTQRRHCMYCGGSPCPKPCAHRWLMRWLRTRRRITDLLTHPLSCWLGRHVFNPTSFSYDVPTGRYTFLCDCCLKEIRVNVPSDDVPLKIRQRVAKVLSMVLSNE